MANRLAVLRGLSRALRAQPNPPEVVAFRPPVSDDRLDRIQARLSALEQNKDSTEDRVVVKVVYRNAENLITHVVERVLTEEEFAEFEQDLKQPADGD